MILSNNMLRLWSKYPQPILFQEMAREFAKAFYNSKEWKDVREYCILRDHHACVHCGKPVEEVHHKITLTPYNINDPNVSLNPDMLISLCHDCHMKEHSKEIDYDYEFDSSGQLVKKSASPRLKK